MKVRLIWEPRGYRPEHSAWNGFVPSLHGGIVSHDLYHHYPNETGTIEEEVRTMGARIRFDSIHFEDKGFLGFSVGDFFYHENRELNGGLRIKKGKKSLPKIVSLVLGNAWLHREVELSTVNLFPDELLKTFTENYERASKFPLKAYKKVRDYNYMHSHNGLKDLVVNLMTGKIVGVEHEEQFNVG